MSKFITADPHFDHEAILCHNLRQPWSELNPNYDPSVRNRLENTRFRPTNGGIEAHDAGIKDLWNKVVKKNDLYIIGDFSYKNHNRHIAGLKCRKHLIRGNHDEMPEIAERNFSSVSDYKRIKMPNGKMCTLFHYAMRTWDDQYAGDIALYGHSHGRLSEYDTSLSFDVGVDVWGYFPVPEEVILAKCQIRFNNRKALMGSTTAEKNDDGIPYGRKISGADVIRSENMKLLKQMGYTDLYKGTVFEGIWESWILP